MTVNTLGHQTWNLTNHLNSISTCSINLQYQLSRRFIYPSPFRLAVRLDTRQKYLLYTIKHVILHWCTLGTSNCYCTSVKLIFLLWQKDIINIGINSRRDICNYNSENLICGWKNQWYDISSLPKHPGGTANW